MKTVLILLVGVVAAGLIYIRAAPSDPARWHVDPAVAPDPGAAGVRIAPGEIISARDPEALLAAFDEAVGVEPRVSVLAGSPAAGHVTYIFRSRVFGFPDYLTVQALPHSAGSTLGILSRLRFGQSDTGVNAARLQRILDRMSVV